MADTARQGRGTGHAAVTLTAAVTCHVCGTIPAGSPEEADKRAEKHTRITGHATTTEARAEPGEAP